MKKRHYNTASFSITGISRMEERAFVPTRGERWPAEYL